MRKESVPEKIINKDGSIVYRHQVCVNRVRKSATKNSMKECYIWADETREAIRKGTYGKTTQPAKSRTMQDVFDRYLANESKAKRSHDWEKKRIGLFKQYGMADWRLDELQEAVTSEKQVSPIIGWMESRRTGFTNAQGKFIKPVKESTLKREMTLLSDMFTKAKSATWKWISIHPLTGIAWPKDGPPRKFTYTDDQVDRIIAALGYTEGEIPETKSQEVAVAFLIALETMMRTQEILLNSVDNYNSEDQYLYVPPEICKTGDERDVALSSKAIALLNLALQNPNRKDDRIFTVTCASKDVLFRKALAKCGIVGARFHDTRRTSTSKLAEILTPSELMNMGGWHDYNMLHRVYFRKKASATAAKLG